VLWVLTSVPWFLLAAVVVFIAWQIFCILDRRQRSLYRPPIDEPAFTDADRGPGPPTPAEQRKQG
jgi:hypothetical protein